MHDLVEKIEGVARIGPPPFWLEKKDLADESQDVGATFFRSDEELDMIRKENEADLVAVPNRAKGEETCDFRRELTLAQLDTPEITRSAHIDKEHYGELALFREFFNERLAIARGNVPIDRSHLITGLVLSHFV